MVSDKYTRADFEHKANELKSELDRQKSFLVEGLALLANAPEPLFDDASDFCEWLYQKMISYANNDRIPRQRRLVIRLFALAGVVAIDEKMMDLANAHSAKLRAEEAEWLGKIDGKDGVE